MNEKVVLNLYMLISNGQDTLRLINNMDIKAIRSYSLRKCRRKRFYYKHTKTKRINLLNTKINKVNKYYYCCHRTGSYHLFHFVFPAINSIS